MSEQIKPFSHYLRRCIGRTGKSPYSLANEIGIDPSSMSRFLSDDLSPAEGNLAKLEETLKIKGTGQQIELYLSVGFAHPLIKSIDRWMDIIVSETSLFGDIEVLTERKDGFAKDIKRFIKGWKGEPITECEELPQPLEFHPFIEALVDNQNKDMRSLSASMGRGKHYLSNMIGKKKIPRRDTVNNISSALKLDKVDNARLFVAVGYAPQDLIYSYPWLPAIATTVDFLNNPKVSTESKDQLGRIIVVKAERWRTDPL